MVRRRRSVIKGAARIGRKEYILTLLAVPGLKGSELVKAAEFRLTELLPSGADNARWDYRRLKSEDDEALLLAVLPDAPASRTNLYIPLFHAVDLKLHRREEGIVLSEAGITDILRPDAEGGFTLEQKENASYTGASLPGRRGYRGAFRKSRGRLILRLAAVSVLVAATALVFRYAGVIREQRNELERLLELRRERTARMEELAALEEQLEELRAVDTEGGNALTAAWLLEILAEACAPGTVLVALEFTPAGTIAELKGPDTAETVASLAARGSLSVQLQGEVRSVRRVDEPEGTEQYRLLLEPAQ